MFDAAVEKACGRSRTIGWFEVLAGEKCNDVYGANINYLSGHACFEATHGTAPKYAGQDKVNPGSLLLSGVMMFEHLGWQDAADDIVRALESTIGDKVVTYDFARQMDGATEVKCSEFASAIVDRL